MRNSLYSVTLDDAFASISGRRTYDILLFTACSALLFTTAFSLSTLYFPRSSLSYAYQITALIAPITLAVFERTISRKRALLFVASTGVVGGLLYTIAQHFFLLSLTIGLKGAVDAAGSVLAVISVVENGDGKYRNLMVGGVVVAGYLGYGLGAMATQYMRGEDIGARFSGLVVAGFWLLCFRLVGKLKESPRYLAVIKGKYTQARSELKEIATMNDRPPFTDVLEGEKVIGFQECPKDACDSPQNQTSVTEGQKKLVFFPIGKGIVTVSQGEIMHVRRFYPWHLLTLPSIRGLSVTCAVTVCCALLLLRAIGAVPGSESNRGKCVIWGVDLFTVLVASAGINATGRLGMSVALLTAAGLSGVLTSVVGMVACNSPAMCFMLKIAEVGLKHTARALTMVELFVLVLFTGESFPTAVRMLGVSMVVAVAGGFSMVAPEVIKGLSVDWTLVGSGGVCLTAVLSCLLPDTNAEELPDYVNEEKLEMQQPADLSQIDIPQTATDDSARSLPPVK